jgi:dTDP-4-amino-4,6-dideoxygalactose transaminase
MIGGFGDVEVFSFHATKFFHTFEGGAIVTNDDALAAKARAMVNFGFAGADHVISVGTNGKMNEISAAMGLTGLEGLDEVTEINRRNYEQYRTGLAELPGVSLISYNQSERCNYQYIVVEINEAVTGISRDEFLKVLHAEKVMARRYFYPGCHEAEPYRSCFPDAAERLPVTRILANRVLALPNGTAIDRREIRGVIDIIHFLLRHCEEVAARLGRQSVAESVYA